MNKKIDKHKKDNIKRIVAGICALAVALAFILSIIIPAYAAPSKDDINAAKEKTKNAQKDVQSAKDKKDAAVKEFEALNLEINETQDEITIIETQIEQTKTDLSLKEEELKKAEKEYNKYEDIFLKRARVMYENGDIAYIDILFGATDFSDLISKFEVVAQIFKYDKDVLKMLSDKREQIKEAKEEIEQILNRQEDNYKTLNNRKATLDAKFAKKEEFLSSLDNDIEKYQAILENAERAEQDLMRQLQSAMTYSANPVNYTGGQFLWPAPSSRRITSPYGYRVHPIHKTRRFHAGVDIGAGYGSDIVAAADGVVVMSAYNGGYGKCIMINHGDGIVSLYGHCSQLLVSKGQHVTRGQLIAKVGSTGASTGPHLHFETRVNGATTNPFNFLK